MRLFASLTSRLVLIAVGLVAAVGLVIALTTTLILRHSLQSQLDDKVESALDRAANAPGLALCHGGPDPSYAFFRGQSLDTVAAYWAPGCTGGGRFTAGGDDDTATVQPLTDDEYGVLKQVPGDSAAHTVSLPGLGSYRVAVATGPGARLVVGLPTSEVDDTISNLVGWEVVLLLVATAAAGGAGAFVVRRQLRPLREVAATAHTVAGLPLASGEIELAERVPARLTDEHTEVGRVGSALNTLLAHVESSLTARHQSEQRVRQFVADASHELRTPLTTISGYTELARRRPDDAHTVRTAFEKVDRESARMTSMVEDLLLLARLDSGRPLARTEVDLSRMLVEAVSDARVVAPEHQWRLDLPEDSVVVTGDPDRLRQVATNLLTNARKYTPPGTTITVTARSGGFTVHDDGPGFPADLLPHAFERFARGDVSRTRGIDGGSDGGAGLGLALVRAITAAHGGSVTLESTPGSTTVTVSLPG